MQQILAVHGQNIINGKRLLFLRLPVHNHGSFKPDHPARRTTCIKEFRSSIFSLLYGLSKCLRVQSFLIFSV